MRKKDQFLSALQQQKRWKISKLFLCAAALLVILLHISSGFAQNPSGTLAGDQVIWEIDNGVLIIHPAEGVDLICTNLMKMSFVMAVSFFFFQFGDCRLF